MGKNTVWVLQTSALPLGYRALYKGGASCKKTPGRARTEIGLTVAGRCHLAYE